MKRREVLKRLSTVAGGTLLPASAWSVLDDYGIRCELTCTTRAGFQRYTFPKAEQARILLVLNVPGEYANVVKNVVIRRVSSAEIEGESEQTNGAIYTFQKYKLHFVARFSRPFDSMGGWVETNITPDAQETREVMEHSYFARPAGYTGDEDEGQMGSFFALMAMGLFEMDGGCSTKPIYEIGSPLFSRIAVHLDKSYYPGRQFVIEAKNNSPENVYTQSATLNGKPLDKPWIFHSDVVKGAMLVLTMGPEPNTKWGSAPEAAPPQN